MRDGGGTGLLLTVSCTHYFSNLGEVHEERFRANSAIFLALFQIDNACHIKPNFYRY